MAERSRDAVARVLLVRDLVLRFTACAAIALLLLLAWPAQATAEGYWWDGFAWDQGLSRTVTDLVIYDGRLLATQSNAYYSSWVMPWDGEGWGQPYDGLPGQGGINTLGEYEGKLLAGLGNCFRWNGTAWETWPGLYSCTELNAFTIWNGKLIAAGNFHNGTDPAVHRWDDSTWVNVGGMHGDVRSLGAFSSRLHAAGGLSLESSIGTRSEGAWHALGLHTGMVETLYEYRGQLVAGCWDSQYEENGIVRWTGVSWEPLGGGIEGDVLDLVVFNGDLVAAGSFTHAGGEPAENIARFDGNEWRPLGGGVGYWAISLAVYQNDLYVGGVFQYAGGNPSNHIARWIEDDLPEGLTLLGGTLSAVEVGPGAELSASYEIAFGPCPNDTLLALDLRLWSEQGAFEAAPYDTVLEVWCGTRPYSRQVRLPADLDPGWYSCNWVVNDGVTNEYIASTGWIDDCLHVVEPETGPLLALSQTLVDFGPVAVEDTSEALVYLTSIGDAPLEISVVQVPEAGFSYEGPGAPPWTLAPDSSIALGVLFHPEELLEYEAEFVFTHNALLDPSDTLRVQGTGEPGIEGYLVVDGMESKTHYLGQDFYPPCAKEPSWIKLHVRNNGETSYSADLRAVAVIGDLYGQGVGDRFWTITRQGDCEVQSESFSSDGNPDLHVTDLAPGQEATILLDTLEHWITGQPTNFVYKVPDFSEIITVYLYDGDEIVAQTGLGPADDFSVCLQPEAIINCIQEICSAFHVYVPIKSLIVSGKYGPQISVLMMEFFQTLNSEQPDFALAVEQFRELLRLIILGATEFGIETGGAGPLAWIPIAAINEITLNGCGATLGSFAVHFDDFMQELLDQVAPEYSEELGTYLQYILSPTGTLQLIIDVTSGGGSRALVSSTGETLFIPGYRDGDDPIEPMSAFTEGQFVGWMPPDESYEINLLGQCEDAIEVRQIYIRPDSSLVRLSYSGLPTWDGSRATLSLAPTAEEFAFAIDIENDGTVDQYWPPDQIEILDGQPPSPVTDFALSIDGSTHTVSWINPEDQDLRGVRVLFSAPYCPSTPFSGPIAVDDTLGAPGEFRSFTLEDMDPMHSYCYRAWTYDSAGNYSEPASGFAFSDVPGGGTPAGERNRLQLSIGPNPVGEATTVRFMLPEAGEVSLDVYDAQGRSVRELVPKADLRHGLHEIHWDGCDKDGLRLPSGVYWLVLQQGRGASTKEVVVVR